MPRPISDHRALLLDIDRPKDGPSPLDLKICGSDTSLLTWKSNQHGILTLQEPGQHCGYNRN